MDASHLIYRDADRLDTKALADYLQLAPQTLAKWRSEGRGPAYTKKGRLVDYQFAKVREWLERQTVETS